MSSGDLGTSSAARFCLHFFWPQGDAAVVGWVTVGAGALALLLAIQMSIYFGKVRAKKR